MQLLILLVQAVAGVPRLFVGQVPAEKQEQDLYPIFAAYGVIEKITIVKGPDGKSKGCAMVQFKRWSDAETAMDAVNGTSPLEGGKGRPLVVHFANPRRSLGSQGVEPAIAPRKLFVGQV
jgi:CUG-BP- and ETR3-like factor